MCVIECAADSNQTTLGRVIASKVLLKSEQSVADAKSKEAKALVGGV